MGIWTGVRDWLNERHSSTDTGDLAQSVTQFNPATGLPIYGGVDGSRQSAWPRPLVPPSLAP